MPVVCRPIHQAEAESFLDILCLSFSLDKSHARSVFYNDPGYDLSRKWGLFADGRMTSILTTTELEFGWGRTMGIAGVATLPEAERKGHATTLLEAVLENGRQNGEASAFLFAHREAVYRRVGFERIDDVLRGEIEVCDFDLADAPLERDQVALMYSRWSESSPARLRRTEPRWKSWTWSFKACEPVDDGYICIEPLLCREAVFPTPRSAWPLAPGTEWVGMTSVTKALQVPLKNARRELIVMARGFPMPPEMFMTDQF